MLPEHLELLQSAAKALEDYRRMYNIESATFSLAQNSIDAVIVGEGGTLQNGNKP